MNSTLRYRIFGNRGTTVVSFSRKESSSCCWSPRDHASTDRTGILAYFIGWMLVVGILLFVRGFGLPGSEDRGTVVLTGGLFVVLGLLVVLWP